MAIATRTTDPIAASLACLRCHLPPGSRVIVFGSQARGEARDDSDLDLLVVEPEVRNRFDEMARLASLLGRELIPADVVVMSDGGPDQHAARRPVVGPHRAARFSSNLVRRFADVLAFEEATVNGNPGVVGRLGDAVAIVVSVEVVGGRVQRVTSVLNPDKLRHVDEAIQLI